MLSTIPYLNFMGKTEEAMTFYAQSIGGELTLQRFKDTPGCDNIPASEASQVMHSSVIVGGNVLLMATDALESMGHKLNFGNNMSIALNVDSQEQADKVFGALSAGGNIGMPLGKTFWNAYFGMCTDKYGIQWMINYQLPA